MEMMWQMSGKRDDPPPARLSVTVHNIHIMKPDTPTQILEQVLYINQQEKQGSVETTIIRE